eukprot:11122464-Karenia_brevis.AAC.1
MSSARCTIDDCNLHLHTRLDPDPNPDPDITDRKAEEGEDNAEVNGRRDCSAVSTEVRAGVRAEVRDE